MAKLQYTGTGRRKSSVARVRLIPGKGDIIVNKKPLDDYLAMERRRLHRTGRSSPSRYLKSTLPGRPRSLQSTSEGSRIPDKRLKNEGKKEVRSQKGQKSKPVLKEIILQNRKQRSAPRVRIFFVKGNHSSENHVIHFVM